MTKLAWAKGEEMPAAAKSQGGELDILSLAPRFDAAMAGSGGVVAGSKKPLDPTSVVRAMWAAGPDTFQVMSKTFRWNQNREALVGNTAQFTNVHMDAASITSEAVSSLRTQGVLFVGNMNGAASAELDLRSREFVQTIESCIAMLRSRSRQLTITPSDASAGTSAVESPDDEVVVRMLPRALRTINAHFTYRGRVRPRPVTEFPDDV